MCTLNTHNKESAMNITLSVNKDLVEISRNYAKKHNTTLNSLVREYLKRIANGMEAEEIVDEFEKLARSKGGRSSADYNFSRE